MKHLLSASLAVAIFVATSADASVGWSDCRKSFAAGYHAVAPHGAVAICRDSTLAIAYDPIMINPAFDAYFLDHTKERSLEPGRDNFYEDPDLKSLGVTQASVESHAFNMSWNKGHLAPSHALSHTSASKHATYTMANVAPQAGHFNQGSWARLEDSTLDWITSNNRSLYVITGVGYKDRSRASRTDNGIAIPDYYWKIMCDKDAKKSVGFYGENIQGQHACGPAKKVKEIQTHYYGGATGQYGDLFDNAHCKIDELDKSHWAGIGGPTDVQAEKTTESEFLSTSFRKRMRISKQN